MKAVSYAIRRVVIALFLVTVASCFMLNLVPGNPGAGVLGPQASRQQIAAFNKQVGFGESPVTRYVNWMDGLVHGNFQRSIVSYQPVSDIIEQRFPVTLELAILAEALAIALAIPLGLRSAHRPGGVLDRAVTATSFGLLSIVPFVLGLLLVYLFALTLHWFPVIGWVPLTSNPLQNLRFAVLPVVTLSAAEFAVYFRLIRADALTTLNEQFVIYARAKGIPERTILRRHVLRPSSISLVTLAGVNLGRLIGGTVIVEEVFGLPGLGSAAVQAITENDFFVVQGIVVVFAVCYVFLNGIIDAMYGVIDPRIRRATT